jgi:catechol 2,3-dioxygenase-like lactoylglutathione lyase family enzyme
MHVLSLRFSYTAVQMPAGRREALQTDFAHMQINVRPENLPFYSRLMAFLGWTPIFEGEGSPGVKMLGVGGKSGSSLWFVGQAKDVANDYDGPGMNHLGIGAQSQQDVDLVAEHLKEQNVALLFGTPQHRPEFAQSADQTYYQVMFETPDRILFEVVYTGPK